MRDTISYSKYIKYSKDHEFWTPIPDDEKSLFLSLVSKVRSTLENGTKKEKGDALENLMTYIYDRFEIAQVHPNVIRGDNQIDHIVEFIEGMEPNFIKNHVGMRLVGESKNHKESISVREVTDLVELLRSKKAKLGVFSSSKTFSRGLNKSPWINAEGKRRKLALSNNNERIIIGFTIDELEKLTDCNFYTLLKQKYFNLVDEIEDDYTDYVTGELLKPYHLRLYDSLFQLKENGILSDEAFQQGKTVLEDKYGSIDQ